MNRNAAIFFTVIGFLLALLFLFSLGTGAAGFGFGPVLDLVAGRGDDVTRNLILGIRLPRILLGIVVGAALAVSGTVYQALFRNPLSEPYLIGISGGAALGATIALVLGWSEPGLVGLALAGAIAITLLISGIGRIKNLPVHTQVLVGISLNVICSSLVMVVHAFSDASRVHNAIMWLMGDLSGASSGFMVTGGLGLVFLTALIYFFHRHLDIIAVNDAFSRNLGVGKLSIALLFWTAALLAALAVSGAGIIGFVGLMAPHVTRNFIGGRHALLVPGSALTGAFFLTFADTLGRSLVPPFELPAGIVTGLAGGIFFLILVIKK